MAMAENLLLPIQMTVLTRYWSFINKGTTWPTDLTAFTLSPLSAWFLPWTWYGIILFTPRDSRSLSQNGVDLTCDLWLLTPWDLTSDWLKGPLLMYCSKSHVQGRRNGIERGWHDNLGLFLRCKWGGLTVLIVNMKCPHGLVCFSTRPLAGRAVWEEQVWGMEVEISH